MLLDAARPGLFYSYNQTAVLGFPFLYAGITLSETPLEILIVLYPMDNEWVVALNTGYSTKHLHVSQALET